MEIPAGFNYGNLTESLKNEVNTIAKHLDEDGYFTITLIRTFTDCDMCTISIRGKDPMLSPLCTGVIHAQILPYLEKIMENKISYNFKIENGTLAVPKNIATENFEMRAPVNINCINPPKTYMPQTPVEILWRLVKNKYYFIWEGSRPVPCSNMYFGDDNFSIRVTSYDSKGNEVEHTIMELVDGSYVYTPFYVCRVKGGAELLNDGLGIADIEKSDNEIDSLETVIVKDDFGRDRESKAINLSRYEKYMFNTERFNKVYEKDYSITVVDRMYSIAMYLDGLNLVLSSLGSKRKEYSLPYKKQGAFTIVSGLQHNTFSIQAAEYTTELRTAIIECYTKFSDKLSKYLKSKDEDLRSEIYELFERECGAKYGILLHYYINGVLDALAIQKGDKSVRKNILTGYTDTVHAEFLMYGLYYYDLRTAFLRHNTRIGQEFNNVFITNEYNSRFFLVG